MRPHEEKEQSQQQPAAEETAEIFHTAGNAAKTVAAYALKTAKNHLFHGAEKVEVACEVASGVCKSVEHPEDIKKVVVDTTMDITLGIVGGAAGIIVGSPAGPLGSAAGYSVGSYTAVKANHLLRDILEDTSVMHSGMEFLKESFDALQIDFRKSRFLLLDQDNPVSLSTIDALNHDLPIAMQSTAITLTPQQQESLTSLHQEIREISADIHQLQDDAKNNA